MTDPLISCSGTPWADLGGRLDVLFHVAGISGRRFGDGPLHECTDEGWDAVMDVNARGLFLTNRAAVRQMLAQPPDDHRPAGHGAEHGLGAGPVAVAATTSARSPTRRARGRSAR